MDILMFGIILFYFIIGAISVFFIGKKTNDEAVLKDRWIKYAVYFVLVITIISCLLYSNEIVYISFVILVLGLYELIKTARLNNNIRPFIFSLLIYFALAYSFIHYSLIRNDNRQLLIYFLVFVFDGFSQITGQLIGKHKFAPRLSPNKTTEGLLGGYIASLITLIFMRNWFEFSFIDAVLFSLLICTSALIGDLLASWYKRICKIKDYSNLIPAHGGVLDRFDSFIFSGSIYWIMITIY